MKREVHKTFIRFLLNKKYYVVDFLEPVLILPFVYGLILLPGGIDKIELITWLVLVFVWAPIIYFLITRRHNKK